MSYPSYLNLYETGELAERAQLHGKSYAVAQSAHKIVAATGSLAKLAYAAQVQRRSSHHGMYTTRRAAD